MTPPAREPAQIARQPEPLVPPEPVQTQSEPTTARHRKGGQPLPGKDQPRGALSIRGLRKTYAAGAVAVDALKGIDLELSGGEFVVVLGPSGSGKTTMLNIVGGIDAASGGKVVVDGEDIGSYDAHELTEYRRRMVGFVFQFYNLIPSLTAMENVALIARLTGGTEHGGAATARAGAARGAGRSEHNGTEHGSSRAARAADEARSALEAVGLGTRLDHFPAALSGGEQQRVAVARALAKHPRLLLCDEPTGALDLDTGRGVLSVLRRVNREQRLTTIIVTHNSAIAAMADRVVRMRDGRIDDDSTVTDPQEADEVTW